MKFHTPHGGSLIRHGAFLCLLFLLPFPAASQHQPPPPPGPDLSNLANFNPSMGVIIIVLVGALFFMGFFSIYIRHCSDNSSASDAHLPTAQTGRSRRGPRGLDPAVIESFPTFDYSAVKSLKIGKGALECAVCLNEFEDDQTLRLIPKCDHVFHPDCIDAWLISHTTCPVCRADLVPCPGESVHTPELDRINEAHQADDCESEIQRNQNDDVAIDIVVAQPVAQPEPVQCGGGSGESIEQPLNAAVPLPRLNRNRTRRNASGRPRWCGRFSRSNSTGHVAVKQWENMDRFTLRLPEEVRRQVISGKLSRTTSCVALPSEGSSRRGNRAGFGGEGSSRGRLFGSGRFDWTGRPDWWLFSLTPRFFSRAPSLRSPRVTSGASSGGSVHSSKAADRVHGASVSEAKLPPV